MPLAHRNFRTAHIQKEVECNLTTFCWCLNRDWVNKLMHVTFVTNFKFANFKFAFIYHIY